MMACVAPVSHEGEGTGGRRELLAAEGRRRVMSSSDAYSNNDLQ